MEKLCRHICVPDRGTKRFVRLGYGSEWDGDAEVDDDDLVRQN